MNDKDKETFEKWRDNNFSKLIEVGNKGGLEKLNDNLAWCWQSACEYMQAGRAPLLAKIARLESRGIEDMQHTIKNLEAQNKQLDFTNQVQADHLRTFREAVLDLEAQNKKLREALDRIDNSNDDMKYFNSDIHIIIHETREALKEKG